MAFFTPAQSPAVVTREIDLTGIVPNVATSTGVYVGRFRWGPVNTPTLVSDEASLVAQFASPDDTTSADFHSAAYFSKYSNSMYVVRTADDSAVNSYFVDTNADFMATISRGERRIGNRKEFEDTFPSLDSDKHSFIAKYPGILGDAISIKVCPVSTNDSAFDNWSYKSEFNSAPGTSSYLAGLGATNANDELHVAIVDKTGALTGTRNNVLETFPYVSLAANAKNPDGSSNYVADVINQQSAYVWLVNPRYMDSDFFQSENNSGINAADETSLYGATAQNVATYDLVSGRDGIGTVGEESLDDILGEMRSGFDTIKDVDAYKVDFLIAPVLNSSNDSAAADIINYMVDIAENHRKDCVVVTSPRLDHLKSITPVTDTADFFSNDVTRSNYLIADNNWLKVFDKYNDKYINIPAASSTAGLMARTDYTNAPWFSPAGLQRGRYFGITDIFYSPNQAERDVLYKAGVNPIANIPGAGVLLYGDKTMQNRPSAFDRINVRRLFLTLERAIAEAAKSVLFEFNDEFTRASFVNIVEPFLREVKGRRGITDFRVVCDETNNTPEIIDRNEFVATIFIKPARSINYVTLNFVATRTGVDFEEVVGLSF